MPSALDGPTGGYRNSPASAPGVDSWSGQPEPWAPSGNVLFVNAPELGKAISEFRRAAAMTSASGRTPQTGPGLAPWGGDSYGTAFGNEYSPSAASVTEGLGGFATLLGGIAEQLEQIRMSVTAAQSEALAAVDAAQESGHGGQ